MMANPDLAGDAATPADPKRLNTTRINAITLLNM